jgi:hypothetical protein
MSNNYITKVVRTQDRKVVSITAEAEGVTISLAPGSDGRPIIVSRKRYIGRNYPGATYVSPGAYAQIIRQTYAIIR